MALHTAGSLFCGIVMVVLSLSILICPVTTVAEGVPVHKYFAAVGLMAILTNHTRLVHLGLQKGTIHIDLILDLSVREIKVLVQQRRPVGIQKRPAMVVVLRSHSSPGMTPGAHLDQLVRLPGNRTPGGDRIGLEYPGGIVCILQEQYESHVGGNIGTASRLHLSGPVDMLRSGTMTRFARYIDFGPCRVICFFSIGVVLSQVGGVALGTHVVPVLGYPCPVQYIFGRDPLILVDVKPPLAALAGRTSIPADGEALVPSPGEFNQVLLQGSDTKHIGDLIVGHLPIGPFSIYHIIAI